MAGMDLLEGRSLSEGWVEFRNKFWELYKVSKLKGSIVIVGFINFFFLTDIYHCNGA